MGTDRYSLLFLPGTYGTAEQPLQIKVGYYTEVAGLGRRRPTTSTINGKVEVYNRCLERTAARANCIALNNFWRTHLQPHDRRQRHRPGRMPRLGELLGRLARRSRCVASTSRAANLSLMDYCSAGPQYASGGFIADSKAVPS